MGLVPCSLCFHMHTEVGEGECGRRSIKSGERDRDRDTERERMGRDRKRED